MVEWLQVLGAIAVVTMAEWLLVLGACGIGALLAVGAVQLGVWLGTTKITKT